MRLLQARKNLGVNVSWSSTNPVIVHSVLEVPLDEIAANNAVFADVETLIRILQPEGLLK